MSMMAAESAGENRGGKKIAGMPRNVVIIGAVALVGGIAWFWYKSRQSSSSSSGGASGGQIIGYDANGNPIYSGSAQTPADFSGELSTLQSEFGSLASEIAQMQGGSGSGGSGSGGKQPCPAVTAPRCKQGQRLTWITNSQGCRVAQCTAPPPGPPKPPKKQTTGGPPGPPPKKGDIWSGAEHKWLTPAQWHAAHVAHQKKVKAKT